MIGCATRNFCVDLQCDLDGGTHQSGEMGHDLVGDAAEGNALRDRRRSPTSGLAGWVWAWVRARGNRERVVCQLVTLTIVRTPSPRWESRLRCRMVGRHRDHREHRT